MAGAPDISQIPVSRSYDLVISSPGGHPKDIDVYQAQKAFSSAVGITRQGGTVILAAACPEGSGNFHYENWIMGKGSFAEVRRQFKAEGFRIGPHKAYMFARDAENIQLKFFSDMEASLASKLLLNPIDDFQYCKNLLLSRQLLGFSLSRPDSRCSTFDHLFWQG